MTKNRYSASRDALFLAIIIPMIIGVVVICAISATKETALMTNPKKGEVKINYQLNKICDGSTLVYISSDAIQVIENSKECQ